jgi:hypothetical protein
MRPNGPAMTGVVWLYALAFATIIVGGFVAFLAELVR